jgi:hypothetical protein
LNANNNQISEALKPLEEFYEWVDDVMAKTVEAQEAHGPPFTCRKGCEPCCYQLVSASIPESLYALEGLVGEGCADIDWWWGEDWWAAHHAIMQGLIDGTLSPKSWLAGRHPCFFRQPDHTCGVYSRRPFECRIYYALTDPSCCTDGRGVVTLQTAGFRKKLYAVVRQIADDLQISCQPAAAMPISLRWAWLGWSKGLKDIRASISGSKFEDPLEAARWWSRIIGIRTPEEFAERARRFGVVLGDGRMYYGEEDDKEEEVPRG